MPYAGVQLMPRDICALVAPHFPNSKIKAVAVALGESQGYVGATHVNDNDTTDLGLFQINTPNEEVPGNVLLTDAKANVDAAYALYEQPWIRNGKQDVRRWQPWVAYTSGWATFPYAWVWHQDPNGNPIGPWLKTGRFLHRAIAGVANWHLLIAKDMTLDQALAFAQSQAELFGVVDGSTPIEYQASTGMVISWKYAPAPVRDPADGVGPRPVPNDGA